MAWNWYQIKKIDETMEEGVPDETLTVSLNLGEEVIRFIQGFSVGIIFRDFLLFPNMNGRNPFTQNDQVGAMIFEDYYWVGVNVGDE